MHDRNGAEEASRNGHKYCMQSVALNEELLNYKNTPPPDGTLHTTIIVGQSLPGKGSPFHSTAKIFSSHHFEYYGLCFLS
jgi:hypothetical protein